MMWNRRIAWFLLAALMVVAAITLVHETIEAHHHLDTACHFCVSVASWLPGDPAPRPLPPVRAEALPSETTVAVVVLLLTSLSARSPPVSV